MKGGRERNPHPSFFTASTEPWMRRLLNTVEAVWVDDGRKGLDGQSPLGMIRGVNLSGFDLGTDREGSPPVKGGRNPDVLSIIILLGSRLHRDSS